MMSSQPPSIDSAGHVVIGQIELNPNYTTNNFYFQVDTDHEFGHTAFGLGDCDNCQTSATIMASPATQTNDAGLTSCDQRYVYRNSLGDYGIGGCSPPPSGCPSGYTWNQSQCACLTQQGYNCSPPPGGCPAYNTWVPYPTCACQYAGSPIIVDTTGKGFHLTSAQDGVRFDIAGNGHLVQVAWTADDSGNGFLALDRNGNGAIDSGKELFGNFTEQTPSDDPNGFLALTVFDRPDHGGNGDGLIDDHDAVWALLRIWIDSNHNGISEPSELYRLQDFGIQSISLNFTESRRIDEYGNMFRYKGSLSSVYPGGAKRKIYDVILVISDLVSGVLPGKEGSKNASFWSRLSADESDQFGIRLQTCAPHHE